MNLVFYPELPLGCGNMVVYVSGWSWYFLQENKVIMLEVLILCLAYYEQKEHFLISFNLEHVSFLVYVPVSLL